MDFMAGANDDYRNLSSFARSGDTETRLQFCKPCSALRRVSSEEVRPPRYTAVRLANLNFVLEGKVTRVHREFIVQCPCFSEELVPSPCLRPPMWHSSCWAQASRRL